MKKNIKLFSALLMGGSLLLGACKKNDNPTPAATVYYQQQDQFGRPAINTVFSATADKDAFNVTTPSAMGAAYQAKFQAKLLALNPAYTTNLLTLNASDFTKVLATDVLTVSTTGPTTFFDGVAANTLSGRTLSDDVIDVELILIFGGPTGGSNSGLTSDNVSANDKAFLSVFPYEAAPW
ncbi:MAG: DUF4331 family protein [Ferruginibacter sp.]